MAQAVTRGPVSGTATRSRKRKPFLLDLYSTAVGKKYVMAITGLIGVGFVVVHMIGNLKAYLGVVNHHGERAYDLDIYGEWLRDLLVPGLPRTVFLWLLRFVLIGAVALHLHAAYTLTIMNRRARPVGYQSSREYVTANFASRTMRWTGVIFLLFLFWHLADFTWGWFNPHYVRGAVYRNLDASLSRIPVAALYVVANVALGVHLFHGFWSMFQSLGWNSPRFNQWRKAGAVAIASLIVVGNVSFPIAVLAGIIEHPSV
jgi:succinate dehydrogenase / fumarate reductase cytochrome b subunit